MGSETAGPDTVGATRAAERATTSEAPAPTRGGSPLASLQRAVGNQAVAALAARRRTVQREDLDGGVPPIAGVGDASESTVAPTVSPLETATATTTVENLNRVTDFSGASDADRLRFLGVLCGGAIDAAGRVTAQRIWRGFGARLPQVAAAESVLWDRCNTQGANLPRSLLGIGAGHVDRRSQEHDVGSWTYDLHGIYDYRVVADALQIKVKYNFVPDSGVSVPSSTWFGYVTSTWNHYSARSTAPTRPSASGWTSSPWPTAPATPSPCPPAPVAPTLGTTTPVAPVWPR